MNSTLTQTKKLTYSALFAAIATAVMFIEFPLPFMPPFLKVDLSGVVSLLAAFMFGPVSAVMITLVKDIIHFFSSSTGGVGELADFLMISTFSVIASLAYRRMHTRKGAVIGLSLGTASMVIIGMLTNKYMLIPFFSNVMPLEAIFSTCAEINPLIGDLNTYIIFGAGPFNLIKGIILSLVTLLLYKRLSVFIKSNTIRDQRAPVKKVEA